MSSVGSYWVLYAESITGVLLPMTQVAYSKWTTILGRTPFTAVLFHYLAISCNRAHAIFFPIHYRIFWSVRLAICLSALLFTVSGCCAFFGTFFDAPELLSIHNMEVLGIYPINFGGKYMTLDNSTKGIFEKGLVTDYNRLFGWIANVTSIPYALVFGRYAILIVCRQLKILLARTCPSTNTEGQSGSSIVEKHDHLSLLFICFGFMVAVPELLFVFLYPYMT